MCRFHGTIVLVGSCTGIGRWIISRKERPPTDYRGMRKKNELRLLLAAFLLLVVVGGGLIGVLFGLGEMLAALPCLLAGAAAIAILYGFFALLGRWADR